MTAPARLSRRTYLSIAAVCLLLLVLGGGLGWVLSAQHQREATQARADTRVAKGAAEQVADPLLAQCDKGDAAAGVLRRTGLCGQAADAKAATRRVAVPGEKGDPGQQGAAGAAGRDSTVAGPRGLRGAVGAAGVAGQTVVGATGPQGAKGDRGEKGDTGAAGAAGRDGSDSTVPGPRGETGATGAAGQSAYPFAFTFTVPGALGDTTYTCTVTSSSDQGACSAA